VMPSTLFRWEELADEDWAARVRAAATVFVNPEDPHDSFLLRERQAWPYLTALWGLILLCIVIDSELFYKGRDSSCPAALEETADENLGGYVHRVRPTWWTADKAQSELRWPLSMAAGMAWQIFAHVLAVHFWISPDTPSCPWFWFALPLLAGQLCAVRLLYRAVYLYRCSRALSDMELSFIAPQLQRGQPNVLVLAQNAKQHVQVERISAELHCYQTDRAGCARIAVVTSQPVQMATLSKLNCKVPVAFLEPDFHEPAEPSNHCPLAKPKTVFPELPHSMAAGDRMHYACQLTVPAGDDEGHPASSRQAHFFPLTAWFLRVEVHAQGLPVLRKELEVAVN